MQGRPIEIECQADNTTFTTKSMKATLFDGVRDALSFWAERGERTRMTLLFPEAPLAFQRLSIDGWHLTGTVAETFSRGEWTTIATAGAQDARTWNVTLPKSVTTPKLRFRFPGSGKVELYDVAAFAQ
jgi:hypothetical protein